MRGAVAEPAIIATELLLEMLEIPSPTGEEDRLAGVLIDRLRSLGFANPGRDPAGNVVAGWGDGPDEVILLGHLDTVAGGIPLRRVGGRVFGRGAVDAKGPLAAAVAAITAQVWQGRCRFTLIAAVDEEGDSRGARFLLDRPAPAHLVILEPSGWDAVTVGYRGSLRVRLTLSQPLAHRAAPGATVGDRVVGFVRRLQTWAEGWNGAGSGFEHLEARVLALNTGDDGISEEAVATVGLRLPPGCEPAAVHAHLLTDPEAAGLAMDPGCAAVRAPKGTALARGLIQGIRVAGGTPRFKVKTGTSDMNLVLPVWGCPAVAYGPGDSRLDHTPEEAIEVDELELGCGVLAAALARL